MGYRVEFRTKGLAAEAIGHRVSACRFPTLLDATRIAAVEANAMALVRAASIEVRIYDRHDQLAHTLVAQSPFCPAR